MAREDDPFLFAAPGHDSVRRALCHDPLPIGGVAVALLLSTSTLLSVPVSGPLLVAGFCGTALVYGLDRAVAASPEDAINRPDRHQWVQAHRTWLRGEAVALGIGAAASGLFLTWHTILAGIGLTTLVALHLAPGGRWGRPLQKMGVVKPVAVAAAWALGSGLLPVLEAGRPVGMEVGALILYRVLFILPNVLLADWADREGDAAAGLGPWTRGSTLRSIRLTATALLGFGGLGILVAGGGFGAPWRLLVDGVGLAVMAGAVWTLRPDASPTQALLLDLVVAWPIVGWALDSVGGLSGLY